MSNKLFMMVVSATVGASFIVMVWLSLSLVRNWGQHKFIQGYSQAMENCSKLRVVGGKNDNQQK